MATDTRLQLALERAAEKDKKEAAFRQYSATSAAHTQAVKAQQDKKQAAQNLQSAQIASRLDNPINSPSVQAKRSAQIARNLDNSLINKATTGTTNPAGMYRPGNVTESLFKTPNYVSDNAMTEMVDRANARWALQQDNTAAEQAREATRKSTEQQKAAMERMVADLYQKMEGYKNNGQTAELSKAEQQYKQLNDRIAQMNSKIHGSAMEEAKDWETQRYNEIMSTGGRVLLANLERLAELSDNRIKEADDERRNGLTETETEYYDLYNNLKTKYGDQVDSWLEYAKRVGNKSQMAMSIAKARQAAEDKPFWASVGSVPLNMASGAGYLDVIGQNLQRSITGSDAPIDYNSPAQKASKMTGAIRGTVSEDMGKFGSLLYNTGMSMADSLVAMPMGNFGMALLGGSAATNAMQAAIERGASDDQALKIGLVAGAMEAALEKTSIDSLFNLTDSKTIADFFTNAFKQSGAELTEEGLTKLGNTFADAVIMGNKSELNAAKRDYIADGYSPEKAEGMALKDWGVDLLLDMAGGALSGGVFGSFRSGFDVVRNGGFQKPTVDSVMPKPKQETQTQPPVADITPTPQQTQDATSVASVTPKLQQTETIPAAEYRQTAAEILSDGIFDSPTYGEALEQTGMKRSDVRDALRTVARNNIAASNNPNVQTVLSAIKSVEVQPVQEQFTPEQKVSDVVSRITGEGKDAPVREAVAEAATQAEPTIEFADGTKQTQAEFVEAYLAEFPSASEAEAAVVFRQNERLNANGIKIPNVESDTTNVGGPQMRTETPEVTQDIRNDKPGAKPAMGAADYGFSGEIGGWKRDADTFIKDTEIPKHDKEGRTVSDSAGSMFSANVPTETKEYIERMSYLGKFNVGHDTNRAQVQRVHDAIAKDGFDDVYTKTIAEIESGKASGDLTARAWVLLVQAANRGESAKAATLAKVINKNAGNTAHALQANAIYYKLSPEGRYASIARTVDKINEELSNEGRKGAELYDVPESDKLKVTKAIGEARETALRQLSGESTQNTNKKRDHGVPVEDWVQEIGKEVAKALDAKPKVQKPKPISRVIRQDILALAKPHWPQAPKAKTTKRTAADTLTDFFANKKQYVEAWNAALEEYRKTHDLGEDFVGANGPGPEKMMVQAIVDEIAAQELKKQKIELFSYLGDQASVEKQIADGLIKRTKADGDNADMIRRAVSQYVNGVRYEANIERISAGLSRDIRNIVEEIGGNMYEIVRDNKGNKAGAAKIVADLMVKRYKISKDAAKTASSKIVERFNSLIAEQTQKTLDAMFADKKKGATKSAAQKITEMGNLGAFDDSRYRDAAVKKAQDTIDAGIGSAIKKIGAKTAHIIRSNKADRAVVANQIKDMLMQDHRLHKEDAQRLSEFILDCFDRRVNASAKKALENYVKPKDKKTQKTLDQRFREMVNMGAFSGSNYADQVSEKLFGNVVKLDPDLIERYKNTTDPDDIRKIEEEIYHSIGEQIPSNFKDKWNAWRFMGMLGTIKAPVRNNLGNVGGWVMRNAKNVPAAAGEALLQKVGKIDQSQRTKTLLPAGKERRDAAKRDFDYVKHEVAGVGKHNIANQVIEDNRRIFTPRMTNLLRKLGADLPEKADNISVEGLRKVINIMMSDTPFSKDAYVSSLANYLRAQGFTGEDFESGKMTQQQKDDARAYAIKEAQEATYRDFNALTELATSFRFNPDRAKTRFGKTLMKAGNVVAQGIQPILKTPANVFARSFEYSPFGIASTIVDAVVSKKNGDFKATKLLNDIGKNSVGVLLSALGYFWAANGKLVISSGDEEQDDLEGKEKYSLIHNGEAYPLDWAAPLAPALFMGAAFYDLFDKRSESGAPLFDKVANVFNSLTNPMIEMSVLSGLKDTIENVRYAENGMAAVVMNAAISYLGQGVPTIWGQIERAVSSPVQERTLINEGDPILNADVQRVLGTLSKKVPGWDYNQVPYIDAWGRVTETGGLLERTWDNVISPFNTSEVIITPVDEEIRRLEKVLDGVNLTPSKAESVITVNGEKIILTSDEYTTYAMEKGQGDLAVRMMQLSSPDYQALDDSTKGSAQLLSEDLADNLAKIAAGFEPKDMPDWQAELIGASVEEMAQACIEQAIDNKAGSSQYENKALGLGDMLENKSIDDQMALACLSETAYNAYTGHCENADISVQQFLDAYGTAYASGKNAAERKQAATDIVKGMDELTPEQKGALTQAVLETIGTIVPVETNVPEQHLLDIGDIDRLEEQMSPERREKYDVFIKDSSVDMQTYLDFWSYIGSEEAASKKDENDEIIKGESVQDHAIAWLEEHVKDDEVKGRLFCSKWARSNCPVKWRSDLPRMPKK